MPIAAGSLPHRVTIQAQTEIKDRHRGFTDGDPTTICARDPAEVRQLTGRELERAMQIDPRITFQVRMRYRPDVAVRHQVVYHAGERRGGDQTLEIVSPPIVDTLFVEMKLLCRETT